MIDCGINSTGKYDNRADPEHAIERRHGDEGALPQAAGNQCITVGCAPKPFPRGADLLTYLYEKLSVCINPQPELHPSPVKQQTM
jgi:hypothetical protein